MNFKKIINLFNALKIDKVEMKKINLNLKSF